jgi:glycosyltransferase involved in cell wall biosynthesis
MYPPHHLGGYELIWRGAVGHLRASGHELRILTTGYRNAAPDPAIPEDPDCHRELGWYWRDHRFPRLGPGARMRLERGNLATLQRHLDGWSPDLVAWWPMGGMSMSMLEHVRRSGPPAVAVVMDDWPIYGPLVDAWQRPLRGHRRRGRLAERLTGIPTLGGLGECAAWTFISDSQRRHVERAVGPLPGARVAHAGVDGRLFRPAPEHPWRWRLLYCGRIDPRKGIDLAVASLAHLPPEATLRVVGDGDPEHRAELERLARDLDVAARVSFERVPRDRLADLFAEHDALLFPVRWNEPWGLVPLEAMAVGTQVVASGRGGSGEYLRDGENCLLADPNAGPAALAAAVARLAGDAELRSRLRAGALATAGRYPDTAFAAAVADAAAAAALPPAEAATEPAGPA